MNHFIHQQQLVLEIENQGKAPVIQEAYRKLYWEKILPEIERLFTELGDENVSLRFDQVEIDLGELPLNQDEEVMLIRLEKEIRKVIGQNVSQLKHQLPTDHSVRYVKPQTWKSDCLLQFLQSGTLPWWATGSDKKDPNILLEEIMDRSPEFFLHALQKIINPAVVRRLLAQFSPSLISDLITQTKLAQQMQFQEMEAFFRSIWAHPALGITATLQKRWQKKWLSIALEGLFLEKHSPKAWQKRQVDQMLSIMIRAGYKSQLLELMPQEEENRASNRSQVKKMDLVPQWNFLLPIIEECKSWKGAVTRVEETKRTFLQKELDNQISAGENRAQSMEPDPDSKRHIKQEQGTHQENAKHQKNRAQIQNEELLAQGVYIDNAGLVLIAPYFKGFFAKLGFTEENQFVSDEAKERAVLLSQYLLRGETDFLEYDLILNKVFCGWSITESIRRDFNPTEIEKAEVNTLFEAFRQHWPAVKKISTAGIRRSFFAREAKLNLEEYQFHLLVARTGVDVLLEKLPWSIGLIRLPWMEKALSVEW